MAIYLKKHKETPEEFLIKYGICSDTTIGTEGDKKLTELLEEYANQAIRMPDVVEPNEQLCLCCREFTATHGIGDTKTLCRKCWNKSIE